METISGWSSHVANTVEGEETKQMKIAIFRENLCRELCMLSVELTPSCEVSFFQPQEKTDNLLAENLRHLSELVPSISRSYRKKRLQYCWSIRGWLDAATFTLHQPDEDYDPLTEPVLPRDHREVVPTSFFFQK